jgi:hypothetical protein
MNIKWKKEHFKILKEEYPQYGPDIQELIDAGFTKQAITSKASKNNIRMNS